MKGDDFSVQENSVNWAVQFSLCAVFNGGNLADLQGIGFEGYLAVGKNRIKFSGFVYMVTGSQEYIWGYGGTCVGVRELENLI